MNLREETAFLQSLLEQQISVEEGIKTSEDLDRYIQKLCVELDASGYVVPEKFELGQFLEEVSKLIAEDKTLDEGKKPFFQRAVSAVKGGIARGLAALPKPIHTKLRQYHAAKATAALDKGDQKDYVAHHQAANFHLKHANPEQYKANKETAKANSELKPGSKKAARMHVYLAKQMHVLHKQLKAAADQPKQSQHVNIDEPLSGSHTAQSSRPGQPTAVTHSEKPTIKTQGATVSMKIKPKVA